MGEIVIEHNKSDGMKDYGTNCLDCERYKRVGEVCVLEHGKRHLSDYCRDFEQIVHLPDYNELMKSVKQDMAAQRQKEKERKERERKQKQKERAAKKEERRRLRISRARKRYLALQKKKENERPKRREGRLKAPSPDVSKKASLSKTSQTIETSESPRKEKKQKVKNEASTLSFAQSSFVVDGSSTAQTKKPKRKSHSSKTPRTASSASATA